MTAPLTGIRVLDLSQIVSGPMAACILADQGAEVIKVEAPSGDPVRTLGPRKGLLSSMFIAVNRGKRGIVLDLKLAAAREVLADLIRTADVLIENFRPGVIDRLGFGYEACRQLNPRLIFTSITGFGPDGPYSNIRVYDPVVQAVSGLAATQTDHEGHPSLIKSLIADKVTALTAAQAITAALFVRERSGQAQRLDVSMLDAAVAFNWPDGMYNHGFIDDAPPQFPEYGSLGRLREAADGYVATSALQTVEFVALCRAVGLDSFAQDPRLLSLAGRMAHRAEWEAELVAALGARDLDTLMAGFIGTGAVGGRVNALGQVARDPQVVHNRTVLEIDHGDLGRVRTSRPPVHFAATPNVAPRPAPWLGQHTEAILRETGRSAEAIAALLASGAAIAASAAPAA